MRHDGAGSSAVGSPEGMRGGDREIREQKKRNHYRKEGAGYQGSRAPGPLSPRGAGRATYHFPHINTVLNTFTHLMPLNIL